MAMRRTAGLLLIVLGALLAFKVSAHASAFDPRTAGYLVMMAGILAAVLPRRTARRVRRGMLVHYYRWNEPPSPPSTERSPDNRAA
jgi:hypothetical protein